MAEPRVTFNQWALGMAMMTARRSTCYRRQVGCILFNEIGHVIATGYNGVARGMTHCNGPGGKTCPGALSPSGTNLDACLAIHAECNALLQCKDVNTIHRCFTTASPCITCVKLLMNTSCKEIYFMDEYPHPAAKELWLSTGREWVQLNEHGHTISRGKITPRSQGPVSPRKTPSTQL